MPDGNAAKKLAKQVQFRLDPVSPAGHSSDSEDRLAEEPEEEVEREEVLVTPEDEDGEPAGRRAGGGWSRRTTHPVPAVDPARLSSWPSSCEAGRQASSVRQRREPGNGGESEGCNLREQAHAARAARPAVVVIERSLPPWKARRHGEQDTAENWAREVRTPGDSLVSGVAKFVDPRYRRLFQLDEYACLGSNIRGPSHRHVGTEDGRSLPPRHPQMADKAEPSDAWWTRAVPHISNAYINHMESIRRQRFDPHRALLDPNTDFRMIRRKISEEAARKTLNVQRNAKLYGSLPKLATDGGNDHYRFRTEDSVEGKAAPSVAAKTKGVAAPPRVFTARAKKSTSSSYLKTLEAKPNIDDFRPANLEVDVISIPFPHSSREPASDSHGRAPASGMRPLLSMSSLEINLEDSRWIAYCRRPLSVDEFFPRPRRTPAASRAGEVGERRGPDPVGG